MLDISLFSIVHCSLQFSSFFFFNDTATTEIYTLSLHDALPILLTLEPGSTRRSPRTDRSTGARREQRPRGRRQDRKSTRLNSSHGYISYAVFCLKKKKKKKKTRETDNSMTHTNIRIWS